MKTQILTLALIFSFTLVSGNFYSDGTKVLNQKDVNVSTIVNFLDNIYFEESLELEDWMISAAEFNSGSDYFIEDKLQFEPWMLTFFAGTSNSVQFVDEELKFECWMMKEFDLSDDDFFRDEELEFESWMFKI